MRNYIRRRLLDIMPELRNKLRARTDLIATYAATHQINSVRGTIEGEGTVRNCFVMGSITVAKNALVANTIIDKQVELIVEEGASVVNCSFHPYSHDRENLPVKIVVGKNCTLLYVWASEDFTVGENGIMAICQINDIGTIFRGATVSEVDNIKGIAIGNNSLIIGTFLNARSNRDDGADAILKIGDDAVLIMARVMATDGAVRIKDRATICEYDYALRLIFKTDIDREINNLTENAHNIVEMISNVRVKSGFGAVHINVNCGDDMYIGCPIGLHGAFDKHGIGNCIIGNAVNIVTSVPCDAAHTRSETTINVHDLHIGDRANIVTEGENWYSSGMPHRCITVGSDTTLIVNAGSESFDGIDKVIPANSLAKL